VAIVLSSTWRNSDWSHDHLRAAGIEWIDATPRLIDRDTVTGRMPTRGHEIQHWFDAHPEVRRYAILDDGADMPEHQMDRLVQTDEDVGLQDEHIDRLALLFVDDVEIDD
jgi:HAD domain in Swiss Army Knife RNA repair proteins